MKTLFQYNWQVRNDWFSWCNDVSEEELLKPRVGGVGGILQTLFHIIVVEYSWICDLKGRPDIDDDFDQHASLARIISLSKRLHPEVRDFVYGWTDKQELQTVNVTHPATGVSETFRHGEILSHVIVHEIHHIGQISVWAREIGRQPVTANLIHRGLFE
ncbi:DinB family protein [Alicyclobacillus dauci]|uniref:DinB family protein n=1 Tax=Alicyclobacillus dauci TaxID=1475485 RepID=A0ABY6YXG3_9BACL|nr:DinB family protein [Alicyclobacillus dauci]WAH35222.1 DinB family protein [Alicyclobacillus dauci]